MQTTALAGDLRHQSAQLRLPAFPVPSDTGFQFPESDLSYCCTPNGVLVSYQGLLVAWIYPGYAGSKRNPTRCQFWDVAFPTLTTGQQNRITGIMLDSNSFDSLAEAVGFIERTFSGKEGAEQ